MRRAMWRVVRRHKVRASHRPSRDPSRDNVALRFDERVAPPRTHDERTHTRQRAVKPMLDEIVRVEHIWLDPAQHPTQPRDLVPRTMSDPHDPARHAPHDPVDCAAHLASRSAPSTINPPSSIPGRDTRPQRVDRCPLDRRRWRIEAHRMHVVPAVDEVAQPRARVRPLEVRQHGDAQPPLRCDRLDVAHPPAPAAARRDKRSRIPRSASAYSSMSATRGTTASSAGCPEIRRYAMSEAQRCTP